MIALDTSIIFACVMPDEQNAIADAAMDHAVEHGAVVPGLMWHELRNILIVSERRDRLTPAQTAEILNDVRDLELEIDRAPDGGVLLELARHYELSAYDATYLELAQRRGVMLATLDKKLNKAAETTGASFK